MSKKYKIIGDIHGRSVWKELVDPEAVNVFVGDYFDPYDRELVPELCVDNMHEIIEYRKHNPGKVVLLLGNHDLHYWDGPRDSGCSRYNRKAAAGYHSVFQNNSNMFHGVAYNIDNKAVVTHAGISVYWYEAWKKYWDEKEAGGHPLWDYERMREAREKITYDNDRHCWLYDGEERHYDPREVVNFCNKLWGFNDGHHFEFTFSSNQYYLSDCYGDSPTHGPLWIRPGALVESDIFRGSGVKQIVGHTQMVKFVQVDEKGAELWFVDVLGQEGLETKCLTIEV